MGKRIFYFQDRISAPTYDCVKSLSTHEKLESDFIYKDLWVPSISQYNRMEEISEDIIVIEDSDIEIIEEYVA